MGDISILNSSDLQFLSEIGIRKNHSLNIIDLPNPTTLSIVYWGQPPIINGVKDFYNKITKLTMENIGVFGEEHQDYISRFNNLKELTLEQPIPIDFDNDNDSEFPYTPFLRINEFALPNSKTAFNNFHFVEVSYYFSCSNSDIKKMLDVGFEYESTRQHNSHYYVTYKNTRF